MGEMIEFPGDGHVDRGYLATPLERQRPGVVVIQEWWGLVPHITECATASRPPVTPPWPPTSTTAAPRPSRTRRRRRR